ncbi:MAG TPA: GNAT family N-acetyltransferase [Chloroflexota bacterium]|nr:GNAT family N-acetyltransferase [Chloroflexota bacterium]
MADPPGLLIRRTLLAPEERAALLALKDRCDRHDGLDHPVHQEIGTLTLLARRDDELLGAAGVQDGDPIELLGLVDPAHRRRGVGRRLLEAAKEEARRRGQPELLLTVDEASAAGLAFAEAVGGRRRQAEYRMELERIPEERDWSPRLELRPATPDDLAAFVAVLAAGFGDPRRRVRAREARRLGDPRQHAYLARLDGRPVGTIRAGEHDDGVYVTSFAVVPELRGRGLGRQMLTRLVRQLADGGRAPIRIEVETENRNALGLYRSCGFRVLQAFAYYAVRTDRA